MDDFIFNDISSFDEGFFESGSPISLIGTGSLGGKAKGLAFIHDFLWSEVNPGDFHGIETGIPKMVVVLSDVFDSFMQQNGLYEVALSDASDVQIAMAFQKAELPFRIPGLLRTFISKIHRPLAVRSSSLLEDSLSGPFAGVYGTKMIPNNQYDVDTCFRKLIEAIKLVYASTYFRAAKDFIRATNHQTEEEKMAVIIQEVVGVRHNSRFYPDISGTARSYNYYPTGHAKPQDGVVNLALGLGKTIVEGGISWAYSPAFPQSPPPFNSTTDMLEMTQTEFWAVNMGPAPEYNPVAETEYLVKGSLLCAEADGALRDVASTYDAGSDRIWPGLSGKGPRVINFAPVLTTGVFPLNKLVKTVLHTCEKALKSPVEIEFAVNLTGPVKRFGFLQVRPIAVTREETVILDEETGSDRLLVSSDEVMGNGLLDSIMDIVFVDFRHFEAGTSFHIAAEVGEVNEKLIRERRPYLLVGYGRWGTSDPTAGIPVKWHQISGARAIVEAPAGQTTIEMSQGSHFFHNLTSFKVFYFSIPRSGSAQFDRDWLYGQKTVEKRKFVRHIRLEHKLYIKADGRTGRGIILKSRESCVRKNM